MSDYIRLYPRLPRRRKRSTNKDRRVEELVAALLDMTQRRDYLKSLNKEIIEENKRLREENKRLHELINKTSQELIELALGAQGRRGDG